MEIKITLYAYIFFVAILSLASYKKGIYIIWFTFLFVPTIILETLMSELRWPMETMLMLASVVMELRLKERRILWASFFVENQRAVLAYLFVSLMIVFLSQTVPLIEQLRLLFVEMVMLLFALQTFLLVQTEYGSAMILKKILCSAIIFNLLFCVVFEVVIGINPAAMPLYILLGVDDNQFIVDMIDAERGNMSFRAQTIYRHPLSLGQYMLVMLPLFFRGKRWIINLFFILIACSLVFLSASRGAMAPMALVLFLYIIKNLKTDLKSNLKRLVFVLVVFIIGLSFVPNRIWKNVSVEMEPIVASLQFWDDEKQEDNDISGSSMEMRINQLNASFIEIEDNPVFGRGYGYREYWMYKHNDLHPDLLGFESVLVYYLVERGWIGLLFFFAMAYYIYRLFSKNMVDKTIIRYIFIGYILSIIMTGVRPLTLLFVCLTCSIVYSSSEKVIKETDIGNFEYQGNETC